MAIPELRKFSSLTVSSKPDVSFTEPLPSDAQYTTGYYKFLGRGTSSQVYEGVYRDPKGLQRLVAIKLNYPQDSCYESVKKEYAIHCAIWPEECKREANWAPFIVKLVKGFEYHEKVFALVFPKLEKTLMEMLLDLKQGLALGDVLQMTKSMLFALSRLEELRIIHGDLRQQNILYSSESRNFKLGDFGIAFYENDTEEKNEYYKQVYTHRAPEACMTTEYDRSVDLWSLAVVACEAYLNRNIFPHVNKWNFIPLEDREFIWNNFQTIRLMQFYCFNESSLQDQKFYAVQKEAANMRLEESELPFKNIDELFAAIRKKAEQNEDNLEKVEQFIDLIRSMLFFDPKKRISIQDALNHPCFSAPFNLMLSIDMSSLMRIYLIDGGLLDEEMENWALSEEKRALLIEDFINKKKGCFLLKEEVEGPCKKLEVSSDLIPLSCNNTYCIAAQSEEQLVFARILLTLPWRMHSRCNRVVPEVLDATSSDKLLKFESFFK